MMRIQIFLPVKFIPYRTVFQNPVFILRSLDLAYSVQKIVICGINNISILCFRLMIQAGKIIRRNSIIAIKKADILSPCLHETYISRMRRSFVFRAFYEIKTLISPDFLL